MYALRITENKGHNQNRQQKYNIYLDCANKSVKSVIILYIIFLPPYCSAVRGSGL